MAGGIGGRAPDGPACPRSLRGMRKPLLIAVAVVAAFALIGVVVNLVGDDENDGTGVDSGALQAAMATAGCQPVVTTALPKEVKHVAGTIQYDDAPPNAGSHSPQTLRNAKRFYSREDNPSPESAVHNLEHGLVVAWYDTQLPADQVAVLEGESQGMGSRFVAVPWNRDPFAGDRHLVLTAWGRTQRCRNVSPVVIRAFIAQHADNKDAPEAGYSV